MSPSPVRAPVASWRPAVRRLSALVVLVLALTCGRVAVVHGVQRGDDTGSPTGSLRPLDLVRSAASRVLAIAQSPPAGITGSEDRRTGIRRVAHDLFAFNEMARRVMGQHSKDCLPQEQDEFVRLFADVFTQAYVTTVERYSGEDVTFLGEEVTGAFAQVRPSSYTPVRMSIGISCSTLLAVAVSTSWDGEGLGSNRRSFFRRAFGVLVRPAEGKDGTEQLGGIPDGARVSGPTSGRLVAFGGPSRRTIIPEAMSVTQSTKNVQV